MTTFLSYIGRLLVISFGFLVAFMIAAFVVSLQVWVASNTIDGLIDFAFFATGLVVLASKLGAFAAALALILILASEWRGSRDWLSYALGGGAVTFLPALTATNGHDVKDLALVLAAGMAGGLAYWQIAGRNAGKLFEKIIAERSKD